MPFGDTEKTEARAWTEVCERPADRGKGVGRRLVDGPQRRRWLEIWQPSKADRLNEWCAPEAGAHGAIC